MQLEVGGITRYRRYTGAWRPCRRVWSCRDSQILLGEDFSRGVFGEGYTRLHAYTVESLLRAWRVTGDNAIYQQLAVYRREYFIQAVGH